MVCCSVPFRKFIVWTVLKHMVEYGHSIINSSEPLNLEHCGKSLSVTPQPKHCIAAIEGPN